MPGGPERRVPFYHNLPDTSSEHKRIQGRAKVAVVTRREVVSAPRQVIAHLNAKRERAEAAGEELARRAWRRRLAPHVVPPEPDGRRPRRFQVGQELAVSKLTRFAEEKAGYLCASITNRWARPGGSSWRSSAY